MKRFGVSARFSTRRFQACQVLFTKSCPLLGLAAATAEKVPDF